LHTLFGGQIKAIKFDTDELLAPKDGIWVTPDAGKMAEKHIFYHVTTPNPKEAPKKAGSKNRASQSPGTSPNTNQVEPGKEGEHKAGNYNGSPSDVELDDFVDKSNLSFKEKKAMAAAKRAGSSGRLDSKEK